MCMKNVKHFALCLPDIHNSRWFFIFHFVFDFFSVLDVFFFYYFILLLQFYLLQTFKRKENKKTLKCKRKRNILLTVVNNSNNKNIVSVDASLISFINI